MANIDIEAVERELWSAADNLRANSNYASNEYFLPVMGLLFLRHAYNRYLAAREEIEPTLPSRSGKRAPLTKAHFSQKTAIYLQEKAQFDYLVSLPDNADRAQAIIDAMESNVPFRFNGNILNRGLITNLPQGCCVEVPCLVDNMGVHPCYVGDLPPQCAALNRGRMAGDELAVRAALELDRKAAEQAVSLDPLTAAVCTLDQIHDMVEELFDGLSDYLPQFRA